MLKFLFLNILVFAQVPSTKLDIDYVHQKYSLSCEPASLAMVLNYHKVKVTEDEIIKKMPFDLTKRTTTTWGDPNIGFVGDINGIANETGYGIHWDPMAKLASNWFKTTAITNSNIKELALFIQKKDPVIIWVYNSNGEVIHWKSQKGKKIFSIKNEHTVIAYGFEGSINNLSGFYIMDPASGPVFWTTAKLSKVWKGFNNSGIVVHGKHLN